MADRARLNALRQRKRLAELRAKKAELGQQTPTETQAAAVKEEPGFFDKVKGVGETALALGSGIVAEPVAGIAGIAKGAIGEVGEALGLAEERDFAQRAGETIESTKEALTFQPRTEEGKAGVEAVGGAIQTAVDAANVPLSFVGGAAELATGQGLEQAKETVESIQKKGVGKTLAERTFEETGSAGAAATAGTIPTAILSTLGIKVPKGGKAPTLPKGEKLSSDPKKAIIQASPDMQKLRNKTTQAYDQLDNMGVKIPSKEFKNFSRSLQDKLKKEGIDKDITPDSNSALKRITDKAKEVEEGGSLSFTDIETLRKVANNAAVSINKSDARLGRKIVDSIDDALDNLAPTAGAGSKAARELASRAIKSRKIANIIDRADLQASGFENGVRTQARQLLNNKKEIKGFTGGEVSALKQIVKGTTAGNMAKFLGKFGLSEGQATSMLGSSIGGATGGTIGAMFGGAPGAAVGAIALPAVGQIAKKASQRITEGNIRYADDLVRAGKNGPDIVKAYLKHTPKKDRNVSDLTDLLLAGESGLAKLSSLKTTKTGTGKIVSDAVFFAEKIRERARTAGGAVVATQFNEEQEK